MVASLLPNGKQQFIDALGAPLVGGLVYFYIPETSTFKDTWQDPQQTILNTNPIVLDDRGQALIYGAGQYRQVLFDADGNLIWDQLTSDYSGGGSGSGIQYGAQLAIASASTTDISTISTHNVIITGTTTIDSFGANADTNNPTYIVQFTDALTLTYNASTFILPGASDIATAAGDSSIWMYLGSGSWQCIEYTPASGTTNSPFVLNSQFFTTSGTFTVPANANASTIFEIIATGAGGGGGGAAGPNAANGAGGGGGTGGIGQASFKNFTALNTITVTIGTGGSAGTSAGGNGGTGGTTTLQYGATTIVTATGGSGGGGITGAIWGSGGAAGSFSTSAGTLTIVSSTALGAQSGFGGLQSGPTCFSGAGGSHFLGQGGISRGPASSAGLTGQAGSRGGGGSGGAFSTFDDVNRAGGAGGTGFVQIRWVGL